jgi:hypothetical protein
MILIITYAAAQIFSIFGSKIGPKLKNPKFLKIRGEPPIIVFLKKSEVGRLTRRDRRWYARNIED